MVGLEWGSDKKKKLRYDTLAVDKQFIVIDPNFNCKF